MKGNKNLISNKSKLNKAKTIQYQNKKNNQYQNQNQNQNNNKKKIIQSQFQNKKENIQKKQEEDKKEVQRKKDIEQENKFRFNLFKKHYSLHLVKRDGNCLFSSISDQVYGTDKHSKIIREKCMDYIEKNKLFYCQFIEGGEAKMPAYIERKRKMGIWGDNLEIQALSEIYDRAIEIYVNLDRPIRSFCNAKINKKFPIKISYHGNKHYNSMVPSISHKDYSLYKKELLSSPPGIYETKFIKNYDISQKFGEKIENINEPIKYDEKENSFDENDFLYQDAIENSKNDVNNLDKNEDKKNKKEEEYLSNPMIKNILELGFNLKDIIEALEVCGNNKELAINYLCNNQN